MKLSLFKKVCLTVMGVGVVGSLVSVGTFATFTATTTNPNNTFAAGTLQITNSGASGTSLTEAGSVGAGLQGPNILSAGSVTNGGTACAAKTVASGCLTLINTSHVTLTAGMEPGQYVQGMVDIKNAGTLPAAYLVQVQNASLSNAANGSNSGTDNSVCPSDIGSAPSSSISVGSVCVKLGDAINIAVEGYATSTTPTLPATPGGGSMCVYGKGVGGSASAPTGTPTVLAAGSACDNIIGTATAGQKLVTGNATDAAGDSFSQFATKLASGVYLPGNTAGNAFTTSAGAVNRWSAGEDHYFVVTLAFPDRGVNTAQTIGSSTVTIGNDNIYQGGNLSFDLLWYAQQ